MTKKYKFFIFPLMAMGLALMIAVACKKDDDNNKKPDQPTAVASENIGTSGGKLAHGTFELEVLPGVFTGSHNLELIHEVQGERFESDEASSFYTVTGIPLDFTYPIRVKIKPDAGVTEDLLMIVGEESYVGPIDTVVMTYNFRQASKEDDSYVYYVSNFENPGGNIQEQTMSMTFGLVANYTSTDNALKQGNTAGESTTQRKFRVYAHKTLINEAISLEDHLQGAYDYIQNELGFSYSKRTKWPVEVNYYKFKGPVLYLWGESKDAFGYYVASKLGDDYGVININSALVFSESTVKATAAHEFFHLVQSLYDPRGKFVKATMSSPWLWVEEAASTWVEGMVLPGVTPSIRHDYLLTPFLGMNNTVFNGPGPHGYGMSGLIKYMVDKYGTNTILELFQEHLNGNNDIIEAFENVFPDDLVDEYPIFMKEYALGNVYNDVKPGDVLGGKKALFSIESEKDSVMVIKANVAAFSGMINLVRLRWGNLTPAHSLHIKAEDWYFTQLLIFKATSSNISYLGTSPIAFTVNDLKSFKDNEESIVIIDCSNVYAEKTLTLRVKGEDPCEGITSFVYGGQTYNTVAIGNQCWMKENLDADIGTNDYYKNMIINPDYDPTDPNSQYLIVIDIRYEYGRLYTAESAQNACPQGWHLPDKDEWQQLIDAVVSQGFPNQGDDPNGIGNALKSCRQINSPLGGSCNTSEHPRWESSDTHHGFDEFGFAALPGGYYSYLSAVMGEPPFIFNGYEGRWWSSTSSSQQERFYATGAFYTAGYFGITDNGNVDMLSVRCVRD